MQISKKKSLKMVIMVKTEMISGEVDAGNVIDYKLTDSDPKKGDHLSSHETRTRWTPEMTHT